MTYTYCTLGVNGYVRLYLAPLAEENVVLKNSLFTGDRSGGRGTIVKNKLICRHEITLQGEFVPTSEMPADHKAAVQTLFGRPTVSAADQFRVLEILNLQEEQNFDLVLGDDRYTAATPAELSYSVDGCVFPKVAIDELRKNKLTKKDRVGWTLRLIAGFETSAGESE